MNNNDLDKPATKRDLRDAVQEIFRCAFDDRVEHFRGARDAMHVIGK